MIGANASGVDVNSDHVIAIADGWCDHDIVEQAKIVVVHLLVAVMQNDAVLGLSVAKHATCEDGVIARNC